MLPDEIARLQTSALDRIEASATPEELEAVRVEVLGRKGSLAAFSKEMARLSPQEKAVAGKSLNAAKQALETAFEARKKAFDTAALARKLDAEWVDLTLPAQGVRKGSVHPISQIQQEIEDVFTSMGFAIVD